MRSATPVEILRSSSVIFIGQATTMINRVYRIGGKLFEHTGLVDLSLKVDCLLGYGLQNPPIKPISEFLLEGMIIKAYTDIRSVADDQQLYGDGVGKCRLRTGTIQVYRPEGGPLLDVELEEIFKDHQYIFSVFFGTNGQQSNFTRVWDLPKRRWVMSTIESGFAPIPNVRVVRKGTLQDYPGAW